MSENNVYLLKRGFDYEGSDVIQIFNTRLKAETAINQIFKDKDFKKLEESSDIWCVYVNGRETSEYYEIEEFEVE